MNQAFEDLAASASARANAFGLLALAFLDPDGELVQRLVDGSFLATLESAAGEPAALESLRAVQASFAGSDPAASLKALKMEYARLFIGPGRAVVSPYETIYDSQARDVRPLLMVSPAAVAVEQAYREAGVALAAGLAQPPDHFATEAEFLYYLGQKEAECWVAGAEAGAREWRRKATSFMTGHLGGWGREFCRLVEAQSCHPFYSAVAHFAAAFLAPGENDVEPAGSTRNIVP